MFIYSMAGVYARITSAMEWIVQNIQDGECHYVDNYIKHTIEPKRNEEAELMEKLKDEFLRAKYDVN